MKQPLLNEIIQQLKNTDFKGLFRLYIDGGLQINPEELLWELYDQIENSPDDDYKKPVELLGKNTVTSIRKYFDN